MTAQTLYGMSEEVINTLQYYLVNDILPGVK